MLATHLGFYNTATTRTHVRFQFSTHAAAGGNVAPNSAFEAADLRIYRANDSAATSATQRSSANGITMTSPFDTLTGVHDVDIDLTDNTDAGFYAAGYQYTVMLCPDETVDSQTLTGVVLAYFEIGVLPVNVTQFGGTAGTFASGVPAVNASQISGDSTAADNLETAYDDTAGPVPHHGIIDQGTAQSATATTLVLRAAASFADDTLNGHLLVVLGSTQGYWQARYITDSVLSTDTVTVDTWTVTPSGTITYKIFACGPISVPTVAQIADGVWDEPRSGHVTAGTFGEYTPANVSHFGGSAGTFASGRPEVNTSHFGGSAGTFASGRPEVNASHIGGSAISQASGVANVNITQISGDTAAADNLETAFDDTAGAVRWTGILDQGTAQAATGTTLRLRSAAAFADDELNGCWVVITGGSAGVGQVRQITDYVSSTDTATVDTWTTTPTGTITYMVLPGAMLAADVTKFGGTAATTSGGRPEVNTTHAAGTAWNSGAIGPNTLAADTITDAKVASDVTIASVTGAVGSVTGNVGGNVTGSVGSLATQAKADVNAEVVDALATDTYAEPSQGAPAATTTLAAKINFLYKSWRNKKDNNGTETKLYADDGSTIDHKQTTSESGGTVTKGEWTTGA